MALSPTYYRPTPNTSLKSTAITAYNSGLLVAAHYDLDAWVLTGNALTQTAVSGTAGAVSSGIAVATNDGASGAWLPQKTSELIHYTSGGVASAISIPSGNTILGVVYVSGQSEPYLMSTSGVIYTVSGASVVSGTPAFSVAAPARWLDVSGTTLFTLFPNASGLGTWTTSAPAVGTSGLINTPMTVPSCLAASQSASAVAVGGWNYSTLASGFSSMALDVATQAAFAGATPAAGAISSWNDQASNTGGVGVWTYGSQVTGLGSTNFVTWNPNGSQIFGCDPTNNHLYVLGFSLGLLSLSQTLSITKATAAAITSGGNNALVCQGSNNTITPLTANVSGVWTASGSTLSIGNPESVMMYAASGAYVGCSSGLALLALSSSGVWSVVSSGATPLGFVPSYLTEDSFGNIYAAGTISSSGVFAVMTSGSLSITGSGFYSGGCSGLAVVAGQVMLADPTNNLIRIWGLLSGIWQQEGTFTPPNPVTALMAGGVLDETQDIFAANATSAWQYNFTAPFTLSRTPTGVLSVYNAGSWKTATLSTSGIPVALAWDASGNISMATYQNTLWSYTSGLTLNGASAIPQSVNQPNSTPIGISKLTWVNGHLYAATSMNDSLVQIQ